ncbi:MAG: hypothetical protein LIO46_00170 [Clostridiales bacterium]|nr:hypothetical protein [Clostridiales bacterium]
MKHMTQKEKQAYREKMDRQRQELGQTVQEILTGYRNDPGKLADYFAFARKFYSYSPRNRLLIQLQNPHAELEVNVLSAVLSDSSYALDEKNAWLDKHLPEIDNAHRFFPPCGTEKKDAVPFGVKETDFLLDDYTVNLNDWEPPARGIKLLNGINHTKGTWTKSMVDAFSPELVNELVSAISPELDEMEPGKEQDLDAEYDQSLTDMRLERESAFDLETEL